MCGYVFPCIKPPEKENLFQSILRKIRDSKKRMSNKREFKKQLIEAVSDGKITSDEIALLDSKYTEYGLSSIDINEIKVQAYTLAFNAAKSDSVITAEEAKELDKIAKYLHIEDSEIENTKIEFARYRLIAEVQRGNLPVVEGSGLILLKGEITHWIERASLLEERVLRSRYVGGSHGISLRIMKGVSYRVGSHRGHLVSDTGIVPVSTGNLIFTNKRITFLGDKISFNLKLEKLLNVELLKDGIELIEASGKNRTLQFSVSDNTEIVGAIVSQILNRME
jgi:hypothetical protein